MTQSATFETDMIVDADAGEKHPNRLKSLSIIILFTTVVIAGMGMMSSTASAGSCSYVAELEGPVLPALA